METISKIELKVRMQKLYDHFIKMANTSYENSCNCGGNLVMITGWQQKSEGYEYCAHNVNLEMGLMGIYLNTQETEMRKEINEMRREECAADAENENEIELDESEIIYHENI